MSMVPIVVDVLNCEMIVNSTLPDLASETHRYCPVKADLEGVMVSQSASSQLMSP